MKTEFLYIKPKSKKAKERFVNKMDSLHSCKIDERKGGRLFLSSVSGRYLFTIPEGGDNHWEVIK